MKKTFAFLFAAAAVLSACREKTPVLTASGLDPQQFVATVPPAAEGDPAFGSAAGRGGETALYVLRNKCYRCFFFRLVPGWVNSKIICIYISCRPRIHVI